MSRKIFILIAAFAVLFSGHMAAAQQAGKVWRIGYLAPNRIDPAFPQRLRELGYVEGKNLAIEFRRAKRREQYPALAKELVARKVDLILSVGVPDTIYRVLRCRRHRLGCPVRISPLLMRWTAPTNGIQVPNWGVV